LNLLRIENSDFLKFRGKHFATDLPRY
jgi:hypothetical protein